MDDPPASKASSEVANSTERKNPHTSVYGVKECTLAKTYTITAREPYIYIYFFFMNWPAGPGPRAETATFWPNM